MSTETGKFVDKKIREGAKEVTLDNLNKSYKWMGYVGDAAVAGTGIGLTWYALKKLVDRAYQRRMEKALLEETTVPDTYKGAVTPVTNEFVMEPEGRYKTANTLVRKKDLDKYVVVDSKSTPSQSATGVVTNPNGTVADRVATEMAINPAVYHSLAFASIPAIVALSSWGANALTKKVLNDHVIPDIVPDLKPEINKAKKKYRDAAMLLRAVTSGKAYEKSASVDADKMEKQANPLLPGLGFLTRAALAAGAAGFAYNEYKKMKAPDPSEVSHERQDGAVSSNPIVNNGANIALGLGALALLYPGYKFVQSMRKAYNDRKDQVSEATRAAQLWKPLQQRRQEQFVRLQAALAQEPELLDDLENTLREKQLLSTEQPTQTV